MKSYNEQRGIDTTTTATSSAVPLVHRCKTFSGDEQQSLHIHVKHDIGTSYNSEIRQLHHLRKPLLSTTGSVVGITT